MAFILALVVIASGALVTYLYDRDAHFFARLAAGACTGFAALGLVGFIFASFLGLTTASIIISAVIVAAPLALLSRSDWRARVRFDATEAWRDVSGAVARPQAATTGALILFVACALIFWQVFGRAMFVRGGEIFTGVDNNLGDLPFHLSIITGFLFGENFPPVHPEYAGARLTYPFVVDFVAAMFVRAGATLEGALFLENIVLALALVGLLYRFALKLTGGDRVAALIAPALALLSGGLGWWVFAREWSNGSLGFLEFLNRLPHDYTISSNGAFRWGNAITTLLVPQRGLLLGLPLALVVITQWWMATGEDDKGQEKAEGFKEEEAHIKGRKLRAGKNAKRVSKAQSEPPPIPSLPFLSLSISPRVARMIGAGVVAGLLPLAHAHSFVVLMLMGGCLALLFPRWRAWFIFFAVALLIAAPQMWWATRESAARAGSFFGWQFGWDRGQQDVFWFWFKNTGLFIPLLVAALAWLAWRGRRDGGGGVAPKRLLLFYLPFTLLFVISNAGKISPWIWDNIKVLYYWYIASVPLVALLLARLWRLHAAARVATVVLLLTLTAAGALDVWRVVSEVSEQREFDRAGIAFAEIIKAETPPRSLILHAPTYNHPVYLTGRRALMGYAGHLWSQGIDYVPREAELRRMYAGAPDAESLLAKHGVEYVVISPLERGATPVNEQFFRRFTKVGETSGYSLYKVARQ
ncbi:MAG TPA: hypothetical protein VGX24_14095 [Pyrinomonadaceae bacterium]|jgi:hypothetical protein|nr:hypothetical protein [Pyrinomonadaceae bacterium]